MKGSEVWEIRMLCNFAPLHVEPGYVVRLSPEDSERLYQAEVAFWAWIFDLIVGWPEGALTFPEGESDG